MTLLRSPRDRSEKYPQPVLRGTQPKRRHGGHVTRLVSGPAHPTLRRWIPDKFSDRVIGWLWPRMREVCALLFWILVGAALAVALVRPWE